MNSVVAIAVRKLLLRLGGTRMVADPAAKEVKVEDQDRELITGSERPEQLPAPQDDFICPFPKCGKRFKRRQNLQKHEYIHQAVKPFKCNWEGCSASYARKQHLERHWKSDHSKPDGEFRCTRLGCVASFDTENSLICHTTRKHGGLNAGKFNCDICPSSFCHNWQLQEHMVSHGQSNPFLCEYCDEPFDVHHIYKTHLKQFHGIRLTAKNEKFIIRTEPYKCGYCGDEFKKWRDFALHSRAAHPFSCQFCSKTFPNRSKFKFHGCEQQENRTRFNCTEDGCKKSYLYERNLTIHIKAAHQGVKHICSICQQKLRTKQKLQEHITNIHENPKPKPAKPSASQLRLRQRKQVKQSVVGRLLGASDLMSLYSMPKPGPKPKAKSKKTVIAEPVL